MHTYLQQSAGLPFQVEAEISGGAWVHAIGRLGNIRSAPPIHYADYLSTLINSKLE